MKKIIGRLFMILGLLLVLSAAALLAYNTWDSNRAGEQSVEILQQLQESPEASAPAADQPKEEHPQVYREMTVRTIEGLDYVGVLSIPDLELELPVQAEWSYDGLQKSPGRFSGATFTDDMTVCAHNYPAHFGRLRSLSQGEEVRFADMDGMVWVYKVAYVTVLEAEDVERMTEKDKDDNWGLTLFTCTPGGQERVTVRCNRTAIVTAE